MVSVIIPTFNEAATLEPFLRDLLNQPGDFEIIVADGGSSDGTPEILSRFPQVRLVRSGGGRAKQMNEGVRDARGEVFFFLHADTFLPRDTFGKIQRVLDDPAVAAGSFLLEFDHPGRIFKILSRFSRINHPWFTYGDQGLFLRAATFKKIGGFKEIPVMEDVEIQGRLRKEGKFIKLAPPVITSSRRYLQNGPLRQHLMTTGVVLLYHLGVSPHLLATFYYRKRGKGGIR